MFNMKRRRITASFLICTDRFIVRHADPFYKQQPYKDTRRKNLIRSFIKKEENEMKEKMKAEAIRRLKLLGLHENVEKEFEKDGTVYYSDLAVIGGTEIGTLFWLTNNIEWEMLKREIEERYDILIYHATHEYLSFGECLTFLYVSSEEEEWAFDREDLKRDEAGISYPVAYVCNLDAPEFSSFGSVGIKEALGGLVRTA